jgi:hypothetical protein
MSTSTSTHSQSDSTESQPDIDDPNNKAEKDENSDVKKETRSGTEAFDITAETQMQFGESGDLEPKDEAVEVTLDQFDIDIDKRETETRLDRPEASGLMKDDRPEADTRDAGEQANLFADAEEQQQTLAGRSAQNQCLFDSAEK